MEKAVRGGKGREREMESKKERFGGNNKAEMKGGIVERVRK